MLGNHSPLSAWRNDNWGGCYVCSIRHDVPRKGFVVFEISLSKAYALIPICDASISDCKHLQQQELRKAILSALAASLRSTRRQYVPERWARAADLTVILVLHPDS